MKIVGYIWVALISLTALGWFVGLVRLISDNSYKPHRADVAVAFFATALYMARCAIDEWKLNREK